MRKCLFLLLVGMILQLTSISSHAGVLIKLKTGRAISGEHYQVEGNGVLLYLDSGTVRIPKADIESIVVTKAEIRKDKKEETKEENKDIALSHEKGKPGEDLSTGKEGNDSYIKRKLEIGERLEEAKKAYFSASEKYEKDNAREKMISISRELFSLQEEVTKRNNEVVPEWFKEN